MGKLYQLRDKMLQLTPERMEKEVLMIVKNNEDTATNLNTDQLFHGKDSDGNSLPNYSPTSVNVYNKPPGPIRLFDSGDFYRGFFLSANKFPIVFSSTDSKTDKLSKAFGYGIFGLQKKNLTDFARSYVLGDIGKFLREFIHV